MNLEFMISQFDAAHELKAEIVRLGAEDENPFYRDALSMTDSELGRNICYPTSLVAAMNFASAERHYSAEDVAYMITKLMGLDRLPGEKEGQPLLLMRKVKLSVL